MFKCIFNQDNLVPNYLAKNFSRHGQIHTRSAKQSDQLNILKSHRDLAAVSSPSPSEGQSIGMASIMIMFNFLTWLTS